VFIARMRVAQTAAREQRDVDFDRSRRWPPPNLSSRSSTEL
jgi:hypothetical protein